ncbi:MAG TPA: EamA family transporter [Candidatus Paceibacterota bacterium]
MSWIILALSTAIFYGVYNFFIKVSSGHINQIAGAVILQLVAMLVGGVILLFIKFTNVSIEISNKGILYAVLAGVFVGLAEITSFFVFSKGITLSIGLPIIIGGSVVFGSLLGILFLKEVLTPIHLLAILLIIVGIVLLVK